MGQMPVQTMQTVNETQTIMESREVTIKVPKVIMEDVEITYQVPAMETRTQTVQRPKTVMEEKEITVQEPRTVMETHSIQIPQYTHTYTTYGAPIMGTVPTGYKSSAPPHRAGSCLPDHH